MSNINVAASQANPTSGASIAFTVVFSAPVSGFTSAGVTLAGTEGGVLAASVSGSGGTYTVTATGMSSSGTVVATIPADATQGGSGNPNFASTSTDNSVVWVVPSGFGTLGTPEGHRAAPRAASATGWWAWSAGSCSACGWSSSRGVAASARAEPGAGWGRVLMLAGKLG
jgi:hypothetical protein